MGVEVVAGAISGSLALVSYAGHTLTDAASIGLSLLAARLAARPARGALTFGFKRAEVLAAQFNGATLLVLGLLIAYEAVRRAIEPPPVAGAMVVAVALVGIGVNLAATHTLSGADRRSMNIKAVFRHILTDLAAFISTAVAGGAILATGFTRADAIASLLIASIMLHTAYGLLRDSGRVFLQAAPEGIDPDAIGHRIAAQAGVSEVHDLHVWEVTSSFPVLSAHIVVEAQCDCHATGRHLKRLLHEELAIDHTTLQVDHDHPLVPSLELPEQRHRSFRSR